MSNTKEKLIGHQELKEANLWMSVVAEFIGTMFLVLIGCGSVLSGGSLLHIGFCFGLTVAIAVQMIGGISGGHINPAVTVGMMVTMNCSIIRGLLYIVSQLVGAVVGGVLLYILVPESARGAMGTTTLGSNVTAGQGFGIELLITFVLVFTVFACVNQGAPATPLMIGLSVTTCHLWAIPFTGSSMNTARTFGVAVAGNVWRDHWVYWLGPLAGGAIAGLLYKLMFSFGAGSDNGNNKEEKQEMVESEA